MATGNISGKMQALRIFQGFAPKQLPKALPTVLDFTGANTSIIIDLEISEQESDLDFVQMVFVDNTKSGQPFTLESSILNHSISMLAGQMGYVPMPAPEGSKFTASVPGAALGLIKLTFFNVPMPAVVWQAA